MDKPFDNIISIALYFKTTEESLSKLHRSLENNDKEYHVSKLHTYKNVQAKSRGHTAKFYFSSLAQNTTNSAENLASQMFRTCMEYWYQVARSKAQPYM